jgi:AcrR family transcriptional regulator
MESPFHLRGYIGPQHTAAWKAMKWHHDTLRAVFQDLDRDPPEYILVRGPALSGKTTFAMQFLDRAASARPDILAVYLPLGATTTSPTIFLQQIRQAFLTRVGQLLDSMTIQDLTLELSDVLASWKTLHFGNLEELLRGLIRELPGRFSRVVLLLDDCDRVPVGGRVHMAEALRTIHADRAAGPLRRFSVLILGRSLLRGPQAVSPLANVVRTYWLRDLSLDDLRAFLERCGEALGGVRFSPESIMYLDRKVSGQAVMLQMICQAAAQDKTPSTGVELGDVLGAVCGCYEDESAVVDRVTNIAKLTAEAHSVLVDVLRELPVPCFEFEPGIAELVDFGMIVPGPNHLSVCRSELVRELLVSRYFHETELPDLTMPETYLITVPNVLAMVVSERLFGRVEERVKRAASVGFALDATRETEAVAALIDSGYPLDRREIQYCYDRYYSLLRPRKIDLEDVLRVVAKIHLAWCKDDE